jgi:arylsulfatase A-like enzyme
MSPSPVRLVAAALACITLAGLATPRRPSVLLIVIDTLRADHLGCYGYARPTSPHLDALARRGVRFANAHAPSSWTAASVASILTGLYPAVHGVETSTSVLGDDVPTIAEAFRARGYATAAFSANPVFVSPVMGFARGFDRFDILHGPAVSQDDALDMIPVDPLFTRFVQVAKADRVTDAAFAWIEEQARGGGPFFAYVHYLDPHADYFPPPEYAARFGVAMDAPLAGVAQRPLLRSFHAPASADDLATLIGLYDGEIAFTDEHVGRLIDEVWKRVAGPMLVVVTADHGEEFGDHGGLLHGTTLWEEQLHVPLIFAGTRIAPGRTIRAPVSLVSVWPMLAGLTGVGTPMDTSDRPSAVPLLGATDPTPIFADLERPSPRLEHWHSRVVIDGSWKLIVASGDNTLVFDLAHDPGEHRDVAAIEPERRVALTESLRVRDALSVAVRARTQPGTSPMTAERRERLKALGYAQ